MRGGRLRLGDRALVMGIVNVTPDSFSDGGLHDDPAAAASGALRMVRDGADLLDLGAESTRPGHEPVGAEAEWERLAPVFATLAPHQANLPPISVDTSKASVAERALAAGAALVNDVWGFRRDPDMARVTAEAGAGAILMHNRETIDRSIDIVDDILRVLARSVAIAREAGVGEDAIVLDPGLGFGKTLEQNFEALAALPRLKAEGYPVLVGLSRKRFTGRFGPPDRTPAERVAGTLAADTYAMLAGADIIRVHDVAAHAEAARMVAALRAAERRPAPA
ncbi:MAG: dihydropteroate synthase [Methylobacteriaceae bacterium]|nr:dihydropteroate synthase [Methylobacteriaceae bacterium]